MGLFDGISGLFGRAGDVVSGAWDGFWEGGDGLLGSLFKAVCVVGGGIMGWQTGGAGGAVMGCLGGAVVGTCTTMVASAAAGGLGGLFNNPLPATPPAAENSPAPAPAQAPAAPQPTIVAQQNIPDARDKTNQPGMTKT